MKQNRFSAGAFVSMFLCIAITLHIRGDNQVFYKCIYVYVLLCAHLIILCLVYTHMKYSVVLIETRNIYMKKLKHLFPGPLSNKMNFYTSAVSFLDVIKCAPFSWLE